VEPVGSDDAGKAGSHRLTPARCAPGVGIGTPISSDPLPVSDSSRDPATVSKSFGFAFGGGDGRVAAPILWAVGAAGSRDMPRYAELWSA
jgi:hypothetical protein